MNIDFENIRREFTEFTKELNASYQGKLISFSVELENSNSLSFTDRINQTFDDIFIFGSPSTESILIGINSAVELLDSDSKKFTEATGNFSFFKKNTISNSDVTAAHFNPIIFCSAKFDPSKNHSLWKDYNSLRLYIPEIIFSFQDEKTFVRYNFLAGDKTSLNDKLAKLENYLNSIFGASSIKDNAPEDYISVSSKESNVEIKNWNEAVTKALDKLKNEQLEKIVLSRVYIFVPKSEIKWEKLLSKLHERFPDCYLFFIKMNESIFFGSSPEMFLKVRNRTAEVESVAGSAARGDRTESDYELEKYLKTSDKNHREHLFVSDFISGILIQYSNDVRIIEEKQIRKLDNIQHLITKISAELNSKEKMISGIYILKEL